MVTGYSYQFLFVTFLCIFFTCFGAAEEKSKPIIHGKLLVIPPEIPQQAGEVAPPQGFARVWAYNKESVHWAKRYPALDRNEKISRFPYVLPLSALQYLDEKSLYVFENKYAVCILVCSNEGTRYPGSFASQIKKYLSRIEHEPVHIDN